MNCNLSETEREIMKFIWSEHRVVKTGEIMDYFVKLKGKDWKRQTLNTLLIRLEDKEVIIRSRGRVQAVYTEEDLIHLKCVNFVKENFAGNIADFLTIYYNGEKAPESDVYDILNAIE